MNHRKRQRYDSFLIWLYHNEKEHLVPQHIRDLIPHSTASDWRRISFQTFVGHEIRDIQQSAIDQYELLEQHRNLKKVVRTITKVWLVVAPIVQQALHRKKEYSEILVNQVQQLITVLPQKMALRIAGISVTSFYERLWKMKVQCGISPMQRCLKRRPMQLSVGEVQKIKALFEDVKLACWPASSLYFEGLRNRGLYISMSTFYKYVNLLGLKRRWKNKVLKTKGFEALQPNEYLHVDTTFWRMADHSKAAIVFVSDNFSRVVLGWSVSLEHGAANVKKALTAAITSIHRHYPDLVSSTLVTDGGGENHAVSISALLNQTESPVITKIIAQKDICFSNSPVEAINRIMKRYLRHHNPQSIDHLENVLNDAVNDYNETRPHGSIHGLTPKEAFTEPKKFLDYENQKKLARIARIAENQQANCSGCSKS